MEDISDYWWEVVGWDRRGTPIVTKEGWYRIKAARKKAQIGEPEETVNERD